ncbi:hypothetical protein HG530_010443 [Fusarium avenaceum]|nr:hypothetical protein HG530_010443 [Fusarium avenaceum]
MASSPPKTPNAIPALAPALVEPLSSETALELALGRLEAPDMSAIPSMVVEADAAPVALARMDRIVAAGDLRAGSRGLGCRTLLVLCCSSVIFVFFSFAARLCFFSSLLLGSLFLSGFLLFLFLLLFFLCLFLSGLLLLRCFLSFFFLLPVGLFLSFLLGRFRLLPGFFGFLLLLFSFLLLLVVLLVFVVVVGFL